MGKTGGAGCRMPPGSGGHSFFARRRSLEASMYVHRVEFCFRGNEPPEQLADVVEWFLSALRMNGQVCGREWPIYFQEDRCVAIVLSPEQGSLDPKYYGEHLKDRLREAETLGISITSATVAEDYSGANICRCADSSAYILYTTFVLLESPIRCLDCFLPVPLYKFPVMPSGDYHEVICWQSDYQSCDNLQMNCAVLERAGTRQLSDVHSSLSKIGRENCGTLADLSGKPFYYYLYRGRGRSISSERQKHCPSCEQPWYLETPLHSLFHYKCDQCRLLSNFAWNLSQ